MAEEDFEALAGEYVLGLLEVGEQLPADPAFARAVRGWELRLMALAESVAPVAPPPRVWAKVNRAITPAAKRRRLAWPLGLGAAGLAVAAALLVIVLGPLWRGQSHGLAMLTDASGGWFAVDANAAQMIVQPEQVSLPAGRVAELWLIAPQHAPKPLGVLAASGPTVMTLPVGLAGSVLAVSLEPPGGSPTGLPTGPVIAEATLRKA
jgi:anti-sigma-K factor RskA